jgi:EAL domain-containing protein (putative c-di-GMP-specific phosphodiesterase class I)
MIVSVAHHLGLTVIAEGVETPEQVVDLTAAGCDLLQGHHLARPQSGQALSATWRQDVDRPA